MDSNPWQLLTEQNALLRSILAQLERSNLGFKDQGGVTKVYCNRSNGCLWYTLTLDMQPVPIPHVALVGYLTSLNFEEVDRRGKKVHKLKATIAADALYILESGHDSHFSKGLLMAAAAATPHQLRSPLTIVPQPGDDEAVLFCRVYSNAEPIGGTYSDETDWKETAKRAIAKVRAAWSN